MGIFAKKTGKGDAKKSAETAPAAAATSTEKPATPDKKKPDVANSKKPDAPKKSKAAEPAPAPAPEKESAPAPAQAKPKKSAPPPKRVIIEEEPAKSPEVAEDSDSDDGADEIRPFSDGASVAYANMASEQNLDDEDEARVEHFDKQASAEEEDKSAEVPVEEEKQERVKPAKRKRADSSAAAGDAKKKEEPAKKAAAKPKGPPPARKANPDAVPKKKPKKASNASKSEDAPAKSNAKATSSEAAETEQKKSDKPKRVVRSKEERKAIADARAKKMGALNEALDEESPLKQLLIRFNGASPAEGGKAKSYVTTDVATMYFTSRNEWDGASKTEMAKSKYLEIYAAQRAGENTSGTFSAGMMRSFKSYNDKASESAYASVAIDSLKGDSALRYKRHEDSASMIGTATTARAALTDIGTALHLLQRLEEIDTRQLDHELAARIAGRQKELRDSCLLNERALGKDEPEIFKMSLIGVLNALDILFNDQEIMALVQADDEDGDAEEEESAEQAPPPSKKQKKN